MPNIVNVYTQSVRASRFIGKKYDNADRGNGAFEVKAKWGEWFENGWFEEIERNTIETSNDTCEESGAYIGLLRNEHGKPHQYWIGMFTSENTTTPEGFDYIDFPKSELGVCWVCGKIDDVTDEGIGLFEQCNERLKKDGMNHVHDRNDVCWTFERYVCPRFTTPDKNGNITLDICFFLNFHY